MIKEYKVDKKIYSTKIVKQVIKDFSEVANMSYENDILKIQWDNEYEIEEIFNEFMNYCIWLIDEN